MKKIQYIFFVLCLALCFSCAVDESCRTNRSVLLDLGLYHVTDNDTIRQTTAMTIDSLTVKALKLDASTGKYLYMDSVLYNNEHSVSKIDLPLHKFELQSVYEITFNRTFVVSKGDTLSWLNKKDTLTIDHANTDQYLSLDCGCIKVHTIDAAHITKHFVDSIHVINPKVNNINVENIQIYK